MSEINNIKATGQLGINSTRNPVNSADNRSATKADDVKTDASRSDKVSLTNAASQLQSLQQIIVDAPTVNNEQVEALRAAVADGSYQADATELAQNMIDFESQLR